MKLRIKADGHNIFLWLPTSLLKSRFAYCIIQRAISDEIDKRTKAVAIEGLSEQREQVNKENKQLALFTRKQHLELYRALKQCIKNNGHFNLVEVHSHDGEKVLIRV